MVSAMMATIKITDRGSGVILRPMNSSSDCPFTYRPSTEISGTIINGEEFLSENVFRYLLFCLYFRRNHNCPLAVRKRTSRGHLRAVAVNYRDSSKANNSGIVFPSPSYWSTPRPRQSFRYLHVFPSPSFFRIISWIYWS